ncbi:dolichyl-phosphate-mannose--protein mannosyltransferase [Microbacterium stercoris]|uniref:Polyprenol-phosphate-mannose--protein mannosyltransferase n=1 Tax=Microbacterium stercoris TaxID=2820289 RepID=A0A939QFT4_9MICO|nr:phospholipid carrier-dependent glycosyltransferase [Microbacterium stercoris]MBO3662134.1 phospholipid carrier-dependent glycosyltransferase [Microbacterium stercoris]
MRIALSRVLSSPRTEWIAPLALTFVAALVRFIGLGHPQELVFDETYYVKDAWTLLHLGYEATWPENANAQFAAGNTGVFATDAAYVVHPPLGKWLIALGLALFGAENAFGWRFSAALFGTLLVPLVYLITRRLSGSIGVALIAGGLLAIDGLAVALSRVSLLDGFLTFFIVLAFWFLLIDRDRTGRLIAESERSAGAVVWNRPWILAAGASLGAACAIKWSGLYVLAGVGVYLVVWDALQRRRSGSREWYAAALLKQAPVTFLQLVPIVFVVYLVSWTGWLVTSGGYDRGSDPNPLLALWNYHRSMYQFHVGLGTSHPYASPAWQWPFLTRPTAMWLNRPEAGTATCGWAGDCIAVIGSHANPIAWYGAWAAVILAIVLLIRRRAGRLTFPFALALLGLALTWGPWLLYPERTIFQFYTVTMLPFLLILLALALGWLAREREPLVLEGATVSERAYVTRHAATATRAWRTSVGVFLLIAVVVGLFFLPLATGLLQPYALWYAHMWVPGWI